MRGGRQQQTRLVHRVPHGHHGAVPEQRSDGSQLHAAVLSKAPVGPEPVDDLQASFGSGCHRYGDGAIELNDARRREPQQIFVERGDALPVRLAGGAGAGIEFNIANTIHGQFLGSHVNTTSYNRMVLLTGEVANEQVKADVEKVARANKDVRGVYNEIRIAPITALSERSNDTRCSARQMRGYEDRLRSLGKSVEIHWFDAGHGSLAMEESIAHQELFMRFAYRVLG